MTNKLKKITKVSFFTIFIFLFFTGTALSQEDENKEETERLSREAQLAMVEAQKFIESQEWANARKPLLDHLATNPEIVEAQFYLMLGYCWYADGNVKEALKVFKKGHETYPDNFDLLSYHAFALYETADFANAAPMLEQVYEKDSQKRNKYLEAAYGAYLQVEKFTDTIRILKKLIKVSQDTEGKEVKQSWYTAIFQVYYYNLRNIDQAEKSLLEALELYPMEPLYWNFLAYVRQEREDYYGMAGAYEIYSYVKPPQKESDWKQLIGMQNDLGLALRVAKNLRKSINDDINREKEQVQIAQSYARALKIDKAVSYLDGILKKRPSSKLMLQKAEILANARKNKETIAACDELITVNKDEEDGRAFFLKGNAAWDLEDWDTMENAFKRAQSYNKYKAYAKYALGFVDSLNEAEKQIKSDYRKNNKLSD